MFHNESFLVRWSRFFITRYRVSILILVAILIAGLWGASNNQRQDFPSIPINFLYVTSVYPGASPADVEREVLIPLEQAATAIEGVDYVRSTAGNSFGSLEVFIESGNFTDTVASTLTDEIGKLGLPTTVESEVQTVEAAGPAVAFGIVGKNGQDTSELLQYADIIRSRLETASPEIRSVEVSPTNEYEVQITLDGEKLTQNNLSYDLVKGAIQSQIVSLPGGSVDTSEGRKESITVNAPIKSLGDIEKIQLGRVQLSDVATIIRAPKDSEQAHFVGYVKDGEPFAKESVYLLVSKKSDGDVVRISQATHEEINNIKKAGIIPDDIDIVTGYDISPYVSDQIDSLLNNGLFGLGLILVVLLFFINLRTALVVALIIPTAFLVTLFVLVAINYSLNILTLFAMILTLGILVDNAIVIAEGMVHELEKGVTKKEAALTSVKKLGPAVTAATLTTIVVFIPFASIGGIMGDFLKYIPYTIMIVLAVSYLLAISITPLLGWWILKEQTYEDRRKAVIKKWEKILLIPAFIHKGQNIIDWLSRGYRAMMRTIYPSRWRKLVVIVVTIVLLGISFGYFAPMLEFEQFPSKDGSNIQVDLTFPAGTPFEIKKEAFLKVQNEIIELPYFHTFYTFGNTVFATFVDPVDRTDDMTIFDIENQLTQRIDTIQEDIGDDIDVIGKAVSYGPPADAYDITVEFLGNNSDSLTNAVDDLESFVSEKEGIKEIYHGPRESLVSSIDVNLNQDKLAQNGVNSLVAAGTINAIFTPQNIGTIVVREDGVSDEVVINFSEQSTDSVDDLRTLFIPSATRGVVQLTDVSDVNQVENPVSIRRLKGNRVATFSLALEEDTDRAILDKEIRDYLTEDKLTSFGLPKDGISYGGEFAAFESDYSRLQIVFLLAMLAVYLILVYQFNSYFQPALILFAVPLALIGVFPGLFTVGSTLNMISGLGVIALVGIVVNDAIVFIATFNRYKIEYPDEGMSERLVRSGYTRFKPIFSTSITTIGGILPLTIYDPFWTGLGTAIIAGLIFSTLGTLIVIPVLYSMWCSVGSWLKNKLSRNKVPSQVM